jgi:hypothetical protein
MKTHYETVNLQLYVIHSFISTREGACCVCGLPGYLAGLTQLMRGRTRLRGGGSD